MSGAVFEAALGLELGGGREGRPEKRTSMPKMDLRPSLSSVAERRPLPSPSKRLKTGRSSGRPRWSWSATALISSATLSASLLMYFCGSSLSIFRNSL